METKVSISSTTFTSARKMFIETVLCKLYAAFLNEELLILFLVLIIDRSDRTIMKLKQHLELTPYQGAEQR
jgi:hypothetical protein